MSGVAGITAFVDEIPDEFDSVTPFQDRARAARELARVSRAIAERALEGHLPTDEDREIHARYVAGFELAARRYEEGRRAQREKERIRRAGHDSLAS